MNLRTLVAIGTSGLSLAVASSSFAQFEDRTTSAGLLWYQLTWGAAFVDIDNDTDLDLYVGHHFYTPSIYWNTGLGEFDRELHIQPWNGLTDRHGGVFVPLDNNETQELFLAHGADGGNGTEPNELYRNDGNSLLFTVVGAGGAGDPQARARSVSAADFDGNRRPDLFVAEAPDAVSRNSLFRNNAGSGFSFTDVAAAAGINESVGTVGGIWGDMDDDGDPDLLVGGEEFSRATVFWRNNGGTFDDASAMFAPPLPMISGADFGDYDNDGDLDVAVTQGEVGIFDTFSEGDTLRYFFNTRFAENGVDGLTIPSTADTLFARFRIRALLDTSKVFLGPLGLHPPTALSFPLTDEYVGSPTFTPGVDQGTYVWREAPGGNWEVRCSTPDVNFDNFDGFVTGPSPIAGTMAHDLEPSNFVPGGPRVWRNDGGSFNETSAPLGLAVMVNPRDVSFVDFDNDGDLDLHVVDQGTSAQPNSPDRLYRNDGAVFTDVTLLEGLAGGPIGDGMGDGGTWGDIDGDMDLDLFLQEGAGPASFSAFAQGRLFVNKGIRDHALILNLVGRVSGVAAIGTKVTAVAGPLRVERRVQANAWRGFQDPLRVHLGLGAAAAADSVIVEWPIGTTQVFTNVPHGFWRLDEGEPVSDAPLGGAHPPQKWRIVSLFPQPAREKQILTMEIPSQGHFTITVHDAAGRLVRRIHEGFVDRGLRNFEWNGLDDAGHRVFAGVYWMRAVNEDAERSIKCVRLR